MRAAAGIVTVCVLFAVSSALCAQDNFVPAALKGQTFIHDPSTIVSEGTNYLVFGTGWGIRTKSSPDLIHWDAGDPVFRVAPAWTMNAVPEFRGAMWAPDVIRLDGKYFLYYSVSSWGKQISAIGLATTPALNPQATNHAWTDCGPVIASSNGYAFNTIDPSVFLDEDGRLWLAFGSYWEGIFLTELNSKTGLRIGTNSPLYRLAWNHAIEAACLTRHEKLYYLFVNWGQCCKGTNSTYEVRVGRAGKVIGPYLDRDDNSLVSGGGSPFLQTSGKFIGPGHIGIIAAAPTDGLTKFSFHYYDPESQGRSRLALGKMDWTNGWPVAVSW
jgi:arabinan endo-1,5-alpha-L-arabinosidase